MNTQSYPEVSSITNQSWHSFVRQQFKRFNDECQLPSRYLNWMSCSKWPPAAATHENQVSFEMTGLLYQWTPVASHSISIAKQTSARQCWLGLVWISVSVQTLHPTRYNPMDFELVNSVAIGFFNETRAFINLISCSIWKMHIQVAAKYHNKICRICGLNPL